jgi:endo-1,4-beta-xylanase
MIKGARNAWTAICGAALLLIPGALPALPAISALEAGGGAALPGGGLIAGYDFSDSFENLDDLAARGISAKGNAVEIDRDDRASGKACLAARGRIGGDRYSELSVEFDLGKYLGVGSYDFSRKVLVVAAFVPEGSPIDAIVLDLRKGDHLVTIAQAAFPSCDLAKEPYSREVPKGRWVEAPIDIKDVVDRRDWGNTWGPAGKLGDEEAVEVVRRCDSIKVYGSRLSAGTPVHAFFLLDDLRWLERDRVGRDPGALSLRNLAERTGKRVGCAAEYRDVFNLADPGFARVLAREFDLLVPCTFPLERIEPSEGAFDFARDDAMLEYAAGNGMAAKCYIGGDHVQLPDWIKKKSFAELGPVLMRLIDEVGTRHRGKVAEWSVFNEVVNDAGDGFRNRQPKADPMQYSPWVDGKDTSLIKAAFREARRVDPGAKLFLNDYINEEPGRAHAEFFYKFVEELVKEGVPIDGVGFELHCLYPTTYPGKPWESSRVQNLDAFLKGVDASVKRYAKLGLLVDFSEIDVPLGTGGIDPGTPAGRAELERKLDYQARIYGGLMRIAMASPNVSSYIVWGFADRYSWVSDPPPNGLRGYGYPDLFGEGYRPKSAYFEAMKELARAGGQFPAGR